MAERRGYWLVLLITFMALSIRDVVVSFIPGLGPSLTIRFGDAALLRAAA